MKWTGVLLVALCSCEGPHCEGNIAIVCTPGEGDSSDKWTCNKVDCSAQARYCAEIPDVGHYDTWAFCALEPRPNPLCDGMTGGVCDGDSYLACNGGYVIGRYDCGPGLCTPGPNYGCP